MSLNSKHILLAITGGIASYKSLFLIRLFTKAGAEVKVVATKNALEFVTPLSIESLSRNSLYHDMFAPVQTRDIHHVTLADWADAVVIAPATANIIGKYAHGIADDALSTLLLATKRPVFIAPAMNTNMYEHQVVQENIHKLEKNGCHIITPGEGALACGDEGRGRMEEPEAIFDAVEHHFKAASAFSGKKVLVTAGPTYEPIDPVRFIGNHSSGLMGFMLAEAFAGQGADVILVTGPTGLQIKHPAIRRVDVVTAHEMHAQVMQHTGEAQIIVMAAAVADYTPKTVAPEKIKKDGGEMNLALVKTKDILAEIGQGKKEEQLVVGFALETENELANAKSKLQNKNLDLIVLNSAKVAGAGFKSPTNQVTIITRDGEVTTFPLKEKREVAKDIVATVHDQWRKMNIH